jgi:hypothetical protein
MTDFLVAFVTIAVALIQCSDAFAPPQQVGKLCRPTELLALFASSDELPSFGNELVELLEEYKKCEKESKKLSKNYKKAKASQKHNEKKISSLEAKISSLEAEISSLEAKISSQAAKISSLKVDNFSLEEEVANLEDWRDRITNHAKILDIHRLFDGVIQEFLENNFQNEDFYSKAQSSTVTVCGTLLNILLGQASKEQKLSWHGPKAKKGKFGKEDVQLCVRSGIQGITFLLNEMDKEEIQLFDRSERNKLVHGFHWFDILKDSTDPSKRGFFEEWSRKMQDLTAKSRNEAKLAQVPPTMEEAFDALVAAFEDKFEQSIDEKDKENMLQMLEMLPQK